jgi:hypothetical protein
MIGIASIRLNPPDGMSQRLKQVRELPSAGSDIKHSFPTQQQLRNFLES